MAFQPQTLDQGIDSVVGPCNGLTAEERMYQETPLFARAILRNLSVGCLEILDYGCGIGRLAKEVLTLIPEDVRILGADTSAEERKLAAEYVASPRFSTCHPLELNRRFRAVYCVYVLQHVPAIDLRDVIRLLWSALADDGVLIYCGSDVRMSVSGGGFVDDRPLGVDVRAELNRYFAEKEQLFTPAEIAGSDVLRKMILGDGGGIAHPALVYTRRAQPVLTLAAPTLSAQEEFDAGKTDLDAGRIDAAFQHFNRARKMAPDSPVPWIGLASAHGKRFELDANHQCAVESLKRGPSADAYAQLAFVHAQRESDAQLDKVIEQGLALDPAHQSLTFAKGMRDLVRGNWAAGWEGWEYRDTRLQQKAAMAKALPHVREWDGRAPIGRILVVGEHGLGDKLLFARYLPMLSKIATVMDVLSGQDAINPLLRVNASGLGIGRVYDQQDSITLTSDDRWVPLESLPRLLRGQSEPQRLGQYLWADLGEEAAVRELMPDGVRVGICWRGSAVPEPYRSMEWAEFAPILEGVEGSLVSLQHGVECPDARVDSRLIEQAENLADTAAIIANLDLVIGVDTSVAHLAAAMGVPTRVLRARPAEWRWGTGVSPWYGDHVQVFMQSVRGVWTDAVKEVIQSYEGA